MPSKQPLRRHPIGLELDAIDIEDQDAVARRVIGADRREMAVVAAADHCGHVIVGDDELSGRRFARPQHGTEAGHRLVGVLRQWNGLDFGRRQVVRPEAGGEQAPQLQEADAAAVVVVHAGSPQVASDRIQQ